MTYELKDYMKAINKTKERLMDTDDAMWEKKYPAYVINKCIAPFNQETVHFVNAMNTNHHVDSKLQFDFLLNSLRSMDRFTPWLKAKKLRNIEYVKEYYGYSNEKAKVALDVLSDEQIKTIKNSLSKGGKNGK